MADTVKNENWSLVIRSNHRLMDLRLRELYGYRDLVWLFVKRDFVSTYKQTILGPAWFILNPLFSTIIYTFIFGTLARIPTDGVPQVLFYYGGTMLWGYFSACLNSAADTFTGNSGLFGKVYFPRLTVPASKVFSNLLPAAIQFGTLIAFYAYYAITGAKIHPTWWILSLPLIVLELAALGTGCGMIVSALTTRYRDLRQLINVGISLWMYATPIVYPLSQVPEKYRWISMINPVTAPIEGFRIALYGVGSVSATMLWISAAATAILLLVGLMLFSLTERTFIDVV